MKKRKLWVSVFAGIMALIMILSVIMGVLPYMASAAKTSSSELKQQLDALKKDQSAIKSEISKLKGQLQDNLDETAKIVKQKSLIDQEIFQLYQQEANINEQIATYTTLIADKQVELDDANDRLAELNRKNKERIRAMEEEGQLSYWSVLFKSNNFADLLDRLNMISEIAAADQRRLKEISDVAKEIEATKTELENERAAQEEVKAELAETQKELEKKREEANKLLEELVAKGDEYQSMVEEAEEKKANLDDDIKDKKTEYNNAKREEWLATSKPPTSSGSSSSGKDEAPVYSGTWVKPCKYSKVSSPYGMRLHPVYKVWKMHYGIDLGAKEGTPIYAVRSGKVKTATYDSSAGYYVDIDHQDGFLTRYFHMTHYVVKKGQTVKAGQVIGYVGSTGTSTGPHLHFGMKYNGSYVNPAKYIKF